MQYNIAEFKRRIEALDGGYTTVAKKYGSTKVQIHKLLNVSDKPRLTSMKKLIKAILEAEEEQAAQTARHAEFFLPNAMTNVKTKVA